jgi:phosphoglycerol transferase MdoB-like AlkP superfamily enzyme
MNSPESDNKGDFKQEKKVIANYLQYSALGFQMFAIIGAFAFIGYRIDENQKSATPLYTAFFSLAGVFIALYHVIRSLKKIKP